MFLKKKRLDRGYIAAWEGKKTESGKLSQNEALVHAMIENAKSSSARENLSNAYAAQERFMLPSSVNENPEFMNRIIERSKKIQSQSI